MMILYIVRLLKYAMEIGAIETIGSLCGHAFAKGIIKDFAKNETILNAGSEIMAFLVKLFGYESKRFDEEQNKNDENN